MFVDEVKVHVSSGKGGDGAVTFHKEKYRPKGGPDGGDGGRGGSVVLLADHNVGSLVFLRDHPHQKAGAGRNGAKNNRSGASAEDLVVTVPVGTVIKNEAGDVIADLARDGDSVVVARGGRGGRGNAAFKSQTRRVPGFGELGEPGEARTLHLELRSIADVAVVGFPNSGKSTLVAAVSAARPKIADYPFTTIEPSLGVVVHGEERFTICDIPGLIEGAHEGKGLGLKFLKHAARASVFVHMIDLADERDPVTGYRSIMNELKSFREDLAAVPTVIALNKIDLVDESKLDSATDAFTAMGLATFPISAMRGEGLDRLIADLNERVKASRIERQAIQGFELFRPAEDPLRVLPEGDAWRVEGAAVRRWVAMTDMDNPEAVAYLQDRLDAAGVEAALAAAGAKHGDEVKIGPVEFEWWPEGTDPSAGRSEAGSR